MNTEKKRIIGISSVIFAVLLLCLFLSVENSRIVTAFIITPVAALICFMIKKRSTLSVNKKEILLLMTVIAVIYVVLKEMTGLYFGFFVNPYYLSLEILTERIVPTAFIIVATEVIRYVILAQKNKTASFITTLSCILAEVLIYSNIAGIVNFNRFMDLVGLTLFPAVSANFFYNYISKRYGWLPNVAFRLITTLYVYFVPSVTGMQDALDSCLRIVLPIGLLAFVSLLFEKKKKNAVQKQEKLGWIGVACTLFIIVSVAMLISCQFRFGALVVATESMTGEINKGDMVIYEEYKDQKIEEGQVIVFLSNDRKIIHRVVKIEYIENEVRYYTKGDANDAWDPDYRTEADIVGLTDMKLAYVGYPTLWLRELIQSDN